MIHIAILSPHLHVLEKLLSHEKTIETRWYQHRVAPWKNIQKGDTIYFKNAGTPITARAIVKDVIFLEFSSAKEILPQLLKYRESLGFSDDAFTDVTWLHKKRYGILIFVQQVTAISPIAITKKGYGSACAWMVVPSISSVTVS